MVLGNIVKRTVLQYNKRLSKRYGCNIYLKREDLQSTRSFKIRGAYNKIKKMNPLNGVICASAGNHAQGVAYVCNKMNIECDIFIPTITPIQKKDRIKSYMRDTTKLYLEGDYFDECLNKAIEYSNKNNKLFIHPFNDTDIIKGQGTIMKEIVEDIGEPNIILCPIGGGGLISGLLLQSRSSIIYGVEHEGSNSMYRSLKSGIIEAVDNADTFADGISVSKVGNITYNICNAYLSHKDIINVSTKNICDSIIDLYQEDGIITEPAGVASVSGLEYLDKEKIEGKNIVCIISGGNNDIYRYNEIIKHSSYGNK